MNRLGLKIFLFVIFLYVCVVMFKNTENFVSGRVTTKYVIHILSKDMGMKVFNDYKDVSNYTDREISSRSKFKVKTRANKLKKLEMKDMYVNNVMDFTVDEKNAITNAINYLFSQYKNKVPLIKEWNIIKLNNIMDWGYPFTLDKYIVLPSERISSNAKELAKTLFHEQLHIIQRKEPTIFKEFFTKQWKFESYELPDDPWINEYLVINPDSDDFYKWKLTDELYLVPLPTTYNKQYSFTEMGMFLNEKGKILAKGKLPYVVPLRQVADYTTRFYNAGSLYHPNEIFATILTEMLFNDLSVMEIDQNGFNAIFKLLKDYF